MIVANQFGNQLVGRRGDDTLIGGRGDDTLRGGAGDDKLTGGEGADLFEMSKGQDQIHDFNPSEGDLVAVDDPDLVSATATDLGVIVRLDRSDDSLLLSGMSTDDLVGYDIFV